MLLLGIDEYKFVPYNAWNKKASSITTEMLREKQKRPIVNGEK